MTQVDFYILPNQQGFNSEHYLCRLVSKIYGLGHQIYIHCQDQQQSDSIDQALWQLDPTSFIPHHQAGSDSIRQVLIGCQQPPNISNAILINLNRDIPSFFNAFQRIVELVSGNDQQRQLSRSHYRFYQNEGLEIRSHEIG